MKKLLVLTVVFVLLAVSTVPALAMRGNSTDNLRKTNTGGRQLYSLAGYITSLAANETSVNVRVAVGNRIADPFVDQTVSLWITSSTRLLLSGGTPIDFDDLRVGQSVSSNGVFENGVWTAYRITVGAILASK